jgi:hypothetical protein
VAKLDFKAEALEVYFESESSFCFANDQSKRAQADSGARRTRRVAPARLLMSSGDFVNLMATLDVIRTQVPGLSGRRGHFVAQRRVALS